MQVDSVLSADGRRPVRHVQYTLESTGMCLRETAHFGACIWPRCC